MDDKKPLRLEEAVDSDNETPATSDVGRDISIDELYDAGRSNPKGIKYSMYASRLVRSRVRAQGLNYQLI